METARVLIEVSKGLIPERADERQRFGITENEWEAAVEEGKGRDLLNDRLARAFALASSWADPNATNWIRVDWLWL